MAMDVGVPRVKGVQPLLGAGPGQLSPQLPEPLTLAEM